MVRVKLDFGAEIEFENGAVVQDGGDLARYIQEEMDGRVATDERIRFHPFGRWYQGSEIRTEGGFVALVRILFGSGEVIAGKRPEDEDLTEGPINEGG